MARTTKGSLYKKGENYYLRYYINGKEFKRLLKYEDGKPIQKQRDAEKARDRIISPYRAKDEAQLRKQAVDALKHAEEKAEDAEALLKVHLKITNGWEAFYNSQTRRDTGAATLINYSRHYSKFQKWLNSEYPEIKFLKDITPAIASKFVAYIKSLAFSKNTINKHNGFLKLFFNVLIQDEKLETNPFQAVRREKQKSNSRKALTKEQIYALLTTAKGELALLIGMGYFTGLRRGDCCTLLWENIDMDKGIITRVPNKIKDRSDEPTPVKIGINEHLYNALASIPEEKRNIYVLPQMAEYYNNSKRDRINRQIKNIFKVCGINTQKSGTGEGTESRAIVEYGFHSLRYSYISHHAEAGTPQAVIQKNAGHKNPAMTEHYTDISDSAALKTSNVLSLTTDIPSVELAVEPERIELLDIIKTTSIDIVHTILTAIKQGNIRK